MLSLDIGGGGSVLFQSDVSDFVDSTWEALLFLEGWIAVGVRWGELEEERH